MIEVKRLETLKVDQRQALLDRPSPLDADVLDQVKPVMAKVKAKGDAALLEFTQLFDRVRPQLLRVPKTAFQAAFDDIPTDLKSALSQAKLQLERFHEPQRLEDYEVMPAPGIQLGQRVQPYNRVGIYVPKNLVSSLLMAAVPARLAGICTLVVCTPPDADGAVPQALLAAASLLGVEELYAVGGAQAIAAMAYGTQSVAKVDKIVGPGNAFVTAAKALVRDEVGIDLLAGPSEVLLWVEQMEEINANQVAHWALDELRAQLEHGSGTSAVLLTREATLAHAVAQALTEEDVKDKNLAVLCYEDLNQALAFVNDYAAEHLCLWGQAAEAQLPYIQSAGSVFLGPWSPVALGDYVSGTNHILPTARQGRFGGGLTVRDFVKTISYQRILPEGLTALAATAVTLAHHEGLKAHAISVEARRQGDIHAQ